MDIDIFESDGQKAEAILQFENLEQQRGWQYFVKIVKLNISICEKKLLEGSSDQTIEEVRRLRDKIKCYNECLNTPKMVIGELTAVTPIIPELDPFEARKPQNTA
jgi:hypothetical protein